MARKRISEFRAKQLLYQQCNLPYSGVQVTERTIGELIKKLDPHKRYVIKVDQGVKGRFKKGLVKLDQTTATLAEALKEIQKKGYTRYLIEENQTYDQSQEKYVSIERTRDGYVVLYSAAGGVNIEQNQQSIQKFVIPYNTNYFSDAEKAGLNKSLLENLLQAFDIYYFSFLEINPFIFMQDKPLFLDAAIEVDSTAEFFVDNAWSEKDFVDGVTKEKLLEEKNIQELAAKSQAAFSLEVLNKNGSIFMMLSGGGASIVLADEVYNQGAGKNLANYGEYSGNPNAEETYIYAKNILSLLLQSTANKKVLIIAGGVANFTDVRVTFNGLIKALDEVKHELQKQHVTICVRRGGPYQEEGLAKMKAFLRENAIPGIVSGPDMVLTAIVTEALKHI